MSKAKRSVHSLADLAQLLDASDLALVPTEQPAVDVGSSPRRVPPSGQETSHAVEMADASRPVEGGGRVYETGETRALAHSTDASDRSGAWHPSRPVSLAELLRAVALALLARHARSATLSVDASGQCAVLALLPAGAVPASWVATIGLNDRGAFVVEEGRDHTSAASGQTSSQLDTAGDPSLIRALAAVGEQLEGRLTSACTVLVDVERGSVAASDATRPLPVASLPAAPRKVFHPGQQALYQKGSAAPQPVTIRRLGKHQIRVAFEDGTEDAIHRKWLTPLDWLPPAT